MQTYSTPAANSPPASNAESVTTTRAPESATMNPTARRETRVQRQKRPARPSAPPAPPPPSPPTAPTTPRPASPVPTPNAHQMTGQPIRPRIQLAKRQRLIPEPHRHRVRIDPTCPRTTATHPGRPAPHRPTPAHPSNSANSPPDNNANSPTPHPASATAPVKKVQYWEKAARWSTRRRGRCCTRRSRSE